MQNLRITFACPGDTPSGGNRVIALYATRLARRGHKVVAVIPRSAAPTLRQRLSLLVRQRKIARANKPDAISFFRNVPFEVRWLNHGDIRDRDVPDADVVIATWWITAEWVWSLSARKGTKLHFVQDYEEWWAPPALIPRVDASYELPIPKIVIAKWVANLLQKKWKQTPIALIPNSVEQELFFAAARGKQIVPTIGFAYSNMPNKGSDVISAAINEAKRSLPSLRVLAFGTAVPPQALLPFVEFHLNVPDHKLRDIYASCDAWLFGTRREGFGLPILEAMACRTPVIGTPAGAGEDLIGKGGGILVPIDNSAAMASAIVKIAHLDERGWRHMSDLALETATGYSWEDAVDKFEDAIRSLIKATAGSESNLDVDTAEA